MPDDVYMETDRLVWRAGRLDDVDALHAIASDFDVVRQTETWPWPPNRGFTASRCLPCARDAGLAGVVTHSGDVIGIMLLTDGGKVGYMFARAHWGQGFATEIGRAAVAYAFDRLGWPKLSACVFADNPASGRVLEKLGFDVVGPCKGSSDARGGVFPTINYAMPRPRA